MYLYVSVSAIAPSPCESAKFVVTMTEESKEAVREVACLVFSVDNRACPLYYRWTLRPYLHVFSRTARVSWPGRATR